MAAPRPKSEMTPEELGRLEEEEFNTGPLSILTESVRNNTQVRKTLTFWYQAQDSPPDFHQLCLVLGGRGTNNFCLGHYPYSS